MYDTGESQLSSSVARGGGRGGGGSSPPPIGLWSMQNRTFLLLFRPIFGEKLKTAPPKEFGCRSREVDVVMQCEKAFEFWPKNQSQFRWRPFFLETTCFWAEKTFEFPILAEKSDSISVKTFFFFWRPPAFGLKKRLYFRAFREISSQFSDKQCETDSRTMKIRVKVVCTFLTLSKKPPFSKSWLRACSYQYQSTDLPGLYQYLEFLLWCEIWHGFGQYLNCKILHWGTLFQRWLNLSEEQARSRDILGVSSVNVLDPNFHCSWIGLRRFFSEN